MAFRHDMADTCHCSMNSMLSHPLHLSVLQRQCSGRASYQVQYVQQKAVQCMHWLTPKLMAMSPTFARHCACISKFVSSKNLL
jgi:hypothetical protein